MLSPRTRQSVLGAPPGVGPPSSTWQRSPNEARTASAVVAGGAPARLALVVVSGAPKAATRAAATACGDSRTATQPSETMAGGSPARAGRARVSGPGQCA